MMEQTAYVGVKRLRSPRLRGWTHQEEEHVFRGEYTGSATERSGSDTAPGGSTNACSFGGAVLRGGTFPGLQMVSEVTGAPKRSLLDEGPRMIHRTCHPIRVYIYILLVGISTQRTCTKPIAQVSRQYFHQGHAKKGSVSCSLFF